MSLKNNEVMISAVRPFGWHDEESRVNTARVLSPTRIWLVIG